MGIKIYKPTSAGRRNSSVNDYAELTTDKPRRLSASVSKRTAAETIMALRQLVSEAAGHERYIVLSISSVIKMIFRLRF